MEVKHWVQSWSPIFALLAVVCVTSAAFLALRLFLVEPQPVALACAADNTGWRCLLREWAVWGFLHDAYGIAALISGALATVARWRWLALLAVVSGIAGAVLYTFELSGVGLLLGALVWVHRTRGSVSSDVADENRNNKQQA